MALAASAPASAFVAALEAIWTEIRQRHSDVPPVMVTVGSGSIGAAPGTLRLGHYAAARWRPADAGADPDALAELFVAGEGLVEGAVDVLGTLLHEAVHGIAHTRGIKDTSRAGAYHNARFKALAEEVGLLIDRHPQIGWSLTTVPPETVTAYRVELDRLRAAIQHVRASEHQARRVAGGGGANGAGGTAAPPARSAPTYTCQCQPVRRLRMAPSVYAEADVLCGACGSRFALSEAD